MCCVNLESSECKVLLPIDQGEVAETCRAEGCTGLGGALFWCGLDKETTQPKARYKCVPMCQKMAKLKYFTTHRKLQQCLTH